jgi:hypothetical protein
LEYAAHDAARRVCTMRPAVYSRRAKDRPKNNFRTSPPASCRWKEVWELAAVVVKPLFRRHEAGGDGREIGKLFVGPP